MATENTRAFAENVAWAFSAHNMATSRALNINTIRKSTYNTAQTYEQSPSIKYGEELVVLARSSLSRGSEVPRVPERSAHRSKNERVFINGWRATQNRSRCVGLPEHREIERNSRGRGNRIERCALLQCGDIVSTAYLSAASRRHERRRAPHRGGSVKERVGTGGSGRESCAQSTPRPCT